MLDKGGNAFTGQKSLEPEDEEKNADDGDRKNVVSLRPVGERYSCLLCHGVRIGMKRNEIVPGKNRELS